MVPFLYHVMRGVGSPVASHWKTAVAPSAMETSTGRNTKCGATEKENNKVGHCNYICRKEAVLNPNISTINNAG